MIFQRKIGVRGFDGQKYILYNAELFQVMIMLELDGEKVAVLRIQQQYRNAISSLATDVVASKNAASRKARMLYI